MNTNLQYSAGSRTILPELDVARLQARLNRRAVRSDNRVFNQVDTDHNLFGSLWSPLRLDLLKAPLTRHHE